MEEERSVDPLQVAFNQFPQLDIKNPEDQIPIQ